MWEGRTTQHVRVWCCERHFIALGELERGQLTEAARELEQLEQQPQVTQTMKRPRA
jgi:hypothetical protein